MTNIDPNIYHIIGLSPGNRYFNDEVVYNLLKTVVQQYGRAAVLIADIPAISTYIALGYPENRARRDKAIPKGNALKNRVNKAMKTLGYSEEEVRIIDWEKDIEENPVYKEKYSLIYGLYKSNPKFHEAADNTTREVLLNSIKEIGDIENAISVAVHYLLSELAFLEFAPTYLGTGKVVYVYHKNWPVYEDYIAGKFDGIIKHNLGFLIIYQF